MKAIKRMAYVSELEKKRLSNIAHTISPYPPEETIVTVYLAGQNNDELEQALDCIYFDDKRTFQVVEIRRQPYFISALITMKPRVVCTPVKFWENFKMT